MGANLKGAGCKSKRTIGHIASVARQNGIDNISFPNEEYSYCMENLWRAPFHNSSYY